MWLKLKSTFTHLITPNEYLLDCFDRGVYGIPTDAKLKKTSTIKLAELLSSSKDGSPKFFVIEREYKRRLADDQAKINRKNIMLAAFIAGFFTIMGILIKELIFKPHNS